jgi:FKBP-type peptidyl-prolyl cis-trans isomerase (trigger factor)
MEEEYEKDWQISAQEGSIVVFDLVTYGYGEKIEWGKLEEQKVELENWAKIVCEKYHCNYEIFIGANYW